MSGKFQRERLPDPLSYYVDTVGLTLTGKGKWRTTRCEFHQGSDSMRIHVPSGAFVCMAGCGARGGDVLAYHRAAHGMGFVEAAKALGAYTDDAKPFAGSTKPTSIAGGALLNLAGAELTVSVMLLADAQAGRMTDAGFERLLAAVGRVRYITDLAND